MARAAKAAGVAARRSGRRSRTRASCVPLDDDRMPTLMGKYKVPHFDAKGEADAALPRARRADDVPADRRSTGTTSSTSAWAPSRARTARSPSRCRWATRSCRASPRKTSAVGLRHLQGAGRAHRADRRHRRRAPDRRARWPPPSTKALGQHGALQRGRRPRSTAASASPAPTTSATCSSSSATSTPSSARRAIWPGRARSIRACRRSTMARPQRRAGPALLGVVPARPAVAAGLAWLLYFVPGVFGAYGIFIDELYYVSCAKRLAWGYVDHPPLAPFLLRGALAMFGDSHCRAARAGGDLRSAGRLPHRVAGGPARRITLRTGDRLRGGRLGAAAAGAVRVLLDERHRAGAVAGPGRHAPRDRTP